MPVHWFERTYVHEHVHEQQKAQFDVQEANLNGAERKARTCQLIEVGGLI